MNLLVLAEESAGIHTLRLLAGMEHRIVAVLTSAPDGTGAAAAASEAERLGLPTRPAELAKDPSLAAEIRSEQVDLLINVHSLYIIRDEILDAPRIGCFNLHPGPLPECAGLDAPSWAIYRGQASHGVTLHWMAARVDAGPIAYESRFPVEERDTGLTLSLKCVRAGLPLLRGLIEDAAAGPEKIPRIEQDLGKRRYFGRKVPQGGRIDWSKTGREVVNFVRACDYSPFRSPWGHPRTAVEGREFGVVKASRSDEPSDVPPGTVGKAGDSGVRVASGDEWILLTRLQVDERPRPAAELLRPGQRLG